MKRLILPASLLAALTFAAFMPSVAEACGGTFCDSGPNSMPVDQTGENVLFVIDDTHVEAHIQIQYDPDADADKFAWVIPMQVLPEFSVGSERLFQNLLAGSVPSYGYNSSSQSCGTDEGGDPTTGDGDGDPTTGDGDGDPGPEIIYQDVVGAFEIAVLQGGTIAEVMQWLGDNGYQQDPNAGPILGQYLDEGYMFVALKLAMNTEVAEIHPIVLRYQGDEPCVPLRLTRIAAVEDMDVRVFILGNARSVPTNYRHVLVNPLKIDWINFAANYKEVVSLAVDAFAAEGNAFVTEYAGTSNVVSAGGLHSASWDASAFVGLQATPEEVVNVLASQGLATCYDGFGCEFEHTMLQPLLEKYLPVPDMIDPVDFYGCLACYAGLIDQVAWDAAAFAADLDERIIAPGAHAVELLGTWPYLTRMFTTVSPNEMNVDPIFHENADLPGVSNVNIGSRYIMCNGDGVFTLPDGREVYLPNPFSWPTFQDEMPWEEDVEQAALVGPNQVLSDRTELIDELLAAWNSQHGWPPGDGDGDGDGDATGDGDPAGDGDGDGSGTGDDPGANTEAACACSTSTRDAGGALIFLALVGLGVRLRRREL